MPFVAGLIVYFLAYAQLLKHHVHPRNTAFHIALGIGVVAGFVMWRLTKKRGHK